MVERCTSKEQRGWLNLRGALWPHCKEAEHLTEMEATCSTPDRLAAFIAYGESGEALGFVETAVRTDYVVGTNSSPVGFIEGIYVVENFRHQGVARALVEAAERWALTRGCRELASDAHLDNLASHAMHRALGFAETERVVYFCKTLEERGT